MQEINGKVVWTVSCFVDDYTGPEWHIKSLKGEFGEFGSKSDAVKKAFSVADSGDVIEIRSGDGSDFGLEYVD